jgi:hypothetical protein
MSGYTLTQGEVLYSGPPANYPAAGGSSTSEVSAMVGATGDYSQPYWPGGFWQQGRQNQVSSFKFCLLVTAQSSATTLTVKLRANTAPNSFTTSDPLLLAFSAITITSYSSGTVWGEGFVQCRGTGFGTSSVSTNLLSSGTITGAGNSTSVTGGGGPTALQTLDFSVNQWLELSVTMSTNSGTNAATLEQFVLTGDN